MSYNPKKEDYPCLSPHWCILCKGKSESIDHMFCISLSNWGAGYGNSIPIPAPIPPPSPVRIFGESCPHREAICQIHPVEGLSTKKGLTLWQCIAYRWIAWKEITESSRMQSRNRFIYFFMRIRFLADCNRINHNQSHGNTSHTYLIFQCIKTLANKFEQSF